MNKELFVINARGEKELFSSKKLSHSLIRVGASKERAKKIAQQIKKEVEPGVSTFKIFNKAKELLAETNKKSSLRFTLKESLNRLGPTGFPFEKFVRAILKENGFKVRKRRYLIGSCLPNYEIDFLAVKEGVTYIGECKYRNHPGSRVHSNTALANKARFEDIMNGPHFDRKRDKVKPMLVTNTKLTSSATKYADCVGMDYIGWRQPKDKGIETLIENRNLYPLTILGSLKKSLRNLFISERRMLVRDIAKIEKKQFLKEHPKVKKYILESVLDEARLLTFE